MSRSTVSQTLASAAFGDDPGRWPLPSASHPGQRWLRAVAAGGQGHYGIAQAELATLRRTETHGSLASLAHSTQGSLLRQLGWHALARGWDGRAVLLAGGHLDARADALVGLAADALGLGRFSASAALLARARDTLGPATDTPKRLAVRVEWVGAELAMATGDGMTALRHARRAVELAEVAGARHRAKSAVVLAAALCCSARLEEARTTADDALDTTARLGLIPLHWAVASLLAGIGSATHSAAAVVAIRDSAAQMVQSRGGSWCPR